jgi:hypothetical protein
MAMPPSITSAVSVVKNDKGETKEFISPTRLELVMCVPATG